YVWIVLGHQGQFAAAARWYAEAFTADPRLLAGPADRHLYDAARAATLAGCGQGRDAADLREASRAGFRRQALDSRRAALAARAELAARRRLLEQDRWAFPLGMDRWLAVPEFAGVRGPEALGRLPEAERRGWRKLWEDVADTLARAERTTPPEPKAGSKIPLPER